jgi:glycosyltransferase involved in cell wall biosynthesis
MNVQNTPLISIIVPTFNHGHYLGRALKSIVDQSYTNWEAIVIDNYSTDNTGEVISGFSDERIKYLKFHNNGVIGVSRNVGIRSAKGEWIAFLDSDDWWRPNKLAECFKLFQRGYDFIYHELEIVRNKGGKERRLVNSWQLRSPIQMDLLMRGNAIATSSVVVKRGIINLLPGFSECPDMVACEDYNLWLNVADLTEKFFYCSDVLGYYSDDGNGISRRDMSLAYKRSVEPFMHKLSASQKKYIGSMITYQKLRYAYLNRDYRVVRLYVFQSIISGPFSIRAKSAVMYFVSLIKG